MRLSRFLSPAAALVLAATFLAIGEGPQAPPDPRDPPKIDAKKEVDKEAKAQKSAPEPPPYDEAVLRRAKISMEGDALVAFLKKRTLPEDARADVEQLVRRLGYGHYRTRDTAQQELVNHGVAALDVLRTFSATSFDVERVRRVERSIQSIYEKDVGPEVVSAAVRVASLRQPAGLVEALIGYLPFADNDGLLDELRLALTKDALKAGKADPRLVAALTDRSAIRRATAAEVLARVAYGEHKHALRKTLTDPDALVRYRAARALTLARERDAIPVLIDTLADLPVNLAWQAEDLLLQLSANVPPPPFAIGNGKEARGKCTEAWQAWWKKHEAKVDLTKLEDTPRLLGHTLIVLLDQNTVLELGPDNLPRWEIKNLVFPLDAQLIGEDRVLIAEHHANRVTERNLRGEMLWQKAVVAPLAAQRLANGNTFVATDHQLLEFDKAGNETMNITFDNLTRKIMKAMKLGNGEIVCLQADARITRYDAQGHELSSFPVQIGTRLYGGRIHMLPNGRVLVPHNQEGKVVEYDGKGKIIWEVAAEAPIAATRLPNGNTLITSMSPSVGAFEVDRTGAHLWSYQHASYTRVTRALRR